jgi:hypothetical protein
MIDVSNGTYVEVWFATCKDLLHRMTLSF